MGCGGVPCVGETRDSEIQSDRWESIAAVFERSAFLDASSLWTQSPRVYRVQNVTPGTLPGQTIELAKPAFVHWAAKSRSLGSFGDMHIAKPNRASHTYRQRLQAPPARVFPLLCPVRETEWAEGWLPELVISSSGVAEQDCVFITPDKLGKAIWYVTRHEPRRWFVEMLKIVPGATACRLEIQLSENGDGCFADITYSHTSIGSAGDEFVTAFTAEYYQRFMQGWETELNHYLKTGVRDE